MSLGAIYFVSCEKVNYFRGMDISFFFFLQLDMLYEGYKQSEIKEIPKAHQLVKWLKENIPKDNNKPGME